MKSISLKNIRKSNSDGVILNDLNLEIPEGKFFALLGPSGCGKTTLLRLIAGFDKPNNGKIFLGKQDITNDPTNKRNINIVFQNYALFPHLTVFENVAYSLKLQKVNKKEIKERVSKLLKAFHIDNQTHKLPSQLSGGQQQRVAVARAIINEPDVLLLDEPLAALDFKLREKMLLELIELQAKSKTTFIYVTHDQFEALTVADQMAIMNHTGQIEQIGTPEQIYEFPISTFVAKFVGTTNIIDGTYHGDTLQSKELGSLRVPMLSNEMNDKDISDGDLISLSIRPEKIEISKKRLENFSNIIEGVCESIVYHGRSTQYNVRVADGLSIHVFDQNDVHFPEGEIDYKDTVFLHWKKENSILLNR